MQGYGKNLNFSHTFRFADYKGMDERKEQKK